jgi:hypothetical protein
MPRTYVILASDGRVVHNNSPTKYAGELRIARPQLAILAYSTRRRVRLPATQNAVEKGDVRFIFLWAVSRHAQICTYLDSFQVQYIKFPAPKLSNTISHVNDVCMVFDK